MNKETTRPLLVAELEKRRKIEEGHHREAPPESPDWPGLAALLEARQAARLARAQAELQLWLADRQWEREEALQRTADKVEEMRELAQENASPTTKT